MSISNLTLDEIERLLYISNDPDHALFVKMQEDIEDQLSFDYDAKVSDAYDDGYNEGYRVKELELEQE